MIRGAGLCAAAGVGLSITDYADLGKWLTVLGVVLLIWSLHRYGRSGADAPILLELAPTPPRAKKKKKRKPSPKPEPEPEPESSGALGNADAGANREE